MTRTKIIVKGGSYLYATPNFMRGWARALDLGATLTEYNDFKDAEEGDAEALYSDWELVGADINEGMGLWKLGNNAE